jgi:mRNA interferase MazF
VKRGDIWAIAGGPDYAGKPRAAVIVQSGDFDATLSVTVCPFTSTAVETVFTRLAAAPSKSNNLQVGSFVMVDKISTVPRSKVGRRIGRMDAKDMALLNQRIALFLGLAG